MSLKEIDPKYRDPDYVVEALNRGIQEAPDGSLSCPVCHESLRLRQSYGVHSRKLHFDYLSRDDQLRVDGYEACPRCDDVVRDVAQHNRAHHPKRQSKSSTVSRSKQSSKSSSAPAVVEQPTQTSSNGNGTHADGMTATDAGLAILAGLRPGSTITVEQLPDVVEWLQQTERIVSTLRP